MFINTLLIPLSMAKLRKFCAYRHLKRPYTRISKYRKKSYVRAHPHSVISHFVMGNRTKVFPMRADLVAKCSLQIRHNALESARMTCNKLLEDTLGKSGYGMKMRVYPFHVIRENPLASGAGADRMSTGMARSFGKPISVAAQVKVGKIVISVGVNKQNAEIAKKALKRASYKLPGNYAIKLVDVAVKADDKEQMPVEENTEEPLAA